MRRAAVVFLAMWVGVGPASLCSALGWSRWNCPPLCEPCPPCPPVAVPACRDVAEPSAEPTPAEPKPVASAPAVDSPPLVARPEQPAAFAPPEAPTADVPLPGETDIEPLTPPSAAAAQGTPASEAPTMPAGDTPPTAPSNTEPEPSRYGETSSTDAPTFTQPNTETPTTAEPAQPTETDAEPTMPQESALTAPPSEPAMAPTTEATPATDVDAESMFDNPPDNRYAPPITPPDASPPAEATPPAETRPQPTPTETEEPDIFDLGQSRRVLDEPGGLSSASVRRWNDAAGQHSCDARLISIAADGVVLDRADGGEARVAFQSLSATDLQFVRRQIHARKIEVAAENAAIAASRGQ